ncbi:MAG: hypothetical protein KHX84_18060 [Enterocloster asparagiformis]|nr:hypothetical protein [Enterocloster asparagiformis]
MKKKLLATVILSASITLGTAFSSFAGWTAGEYQDEGIDWYYHDDATGALVTNAWTPDGYYVNSVGLWCPYILYENESYDDYLTKVTNTILDYYNQTQKWSFDFKTDYVFPSAEAVIAFNQALHDKLTTQIKYPYTYAGYTSTDNGYLLTGAFVELRDY